VLNGDDADRGDERVEPTLDVAALGTFRELDAASGGDFAGELIDEFLREAVTQVAQLREAAGRGDASAARAAAHRLKGSALTMGARRLAALCDRAEQRDHAREDGTSAIAAAIETELDRVRAALAAERRTWDPR
jgi:HPt (histidine-containing phosphotransfer) domain-containing protein